MSRLKGVVFSLVGFAFVLLTAVPAEARTWPIKPSMTRAEIQQVFDQAKDGDRIMFHKGVYDFSDGPWLQNGINGAAIVITDKSLTVVGQKGAVIKGRGNVPDTGRAESSGITAFQVVNPDQTKDVVFDNLTIETFMYGIAASVNSPYPDTAPNLHDVIIRGCTFKDIRRNCIVVGKNSGNVTIVDNVIEEARHCGVWVAWISPGDVNRWQSEGAVTDISRNSIRGGTLAIIVNHANNLRILDNDLEGIGPNHYYGITLTGLKAGGLIADNNIRHWFYGIELYAPAGEEFHEAVVRGNTLSDITFGWGWGIILDGGNVHDCVVEGNAVDVNLKGYAAISTDGYNNRFTDNILTGAAYNAVLLAYWDENSVAHNEYFEANSIAGFTPPYESHYYLDLGAHDNTIKGICAENGTYIDASGEGTNNIITCLTDFYGLSSTALRRAVNLSARPQARPKIEW